MAPLPRVSRIRRQDFRPLVPGSAIQIPREAAFSMLKSEKFDSDDLTILKKFIVTETVDVLDLLGALLREVGRLDSTLTSYDDAIALRVASAEELEKKVTEVRGERDKMQRVYDQAYAVLCLPCKIPLEILTQIFIACLPPHPRPRTRSAPLLLCSVCTIWRRIALHTPALWNSITLYQSKQVAKMPLVSKKWFSNAGRLPLTLRFEPESAQHRLGYHNANVASNRLGHDITNLELSCVLAGDPVLLQLQNLLNIYNIQRISLKASSPYTTAAAPPSHFPNLRKLILPNRIEPNAEFVMLHSFGLTHLCISGGWLSAQLWSSLIRQCTSLRHGVFEINQVHVPHTPHPVIPLKHLISLRLILCTDGHPSLLDDLSFPSLTFFSIGYIKKTRGPWDSRYLTPIKVDQLRALALYRLTIPYRDLMDILKMANSLESLVLDVPFRSATLFKQMKMDGNHPCSVFMPKLSKFTIYHYAKVEDRLHTFDKYGFMQFVKSRWQNNRSAGSCHGRISFVSVQIESTDYRIEALKYMLGEMKRKGLRVRIGVSSHGYQASTEVNW